MTRSWLLSLVPALWSVHVVVSNRAVDDPSARFRRFADARYVRQDRADPERVVPLVIGVFPGDFAALERALYGVSDPTYVAGYGPASSMQEKMALLGVELTY